MFEIVNGNSQGQLVSANFGQRQNYRLKLPMGKERDPWKTRIVMSPLPANQLPSSTRRDGAKEVCAIETVLDPQDMKREYCGKIRYLHPSGADCGLPLGKNRHWYNFGKEYNRAEFEVRLLAQTGLRFEIWNKDGLRRSRDHDEIEVQWESADGRLPPPPPAQEQGYGIYRW